MKIQKSDQAAETDSRSEKHLQNKTITTVMHRRRRRSIRRIRKVVPMCTPIWYAG